MKHGIQINSKSKAVIFITNDGLLEISIDCWKFPLIINVLLRI
jgi:hypothetical protein